MKQTIAIINFNTPELTEACIMSIRKHGCDWPVVIFDNSTKTKLQDGDTVEARPFKKKLKNVKILDNTKGQIIDFEKWLDSIPGKNEQIGISGNYRWGSARHIYTVQKLWSLIPDGFILIESDTLVKRDIRELWKPEYSFVGYRQLHQIGNRADIPRILPMLCYMNVPLLTREGARYYDPQRCWGLLPDFNARGNWYDTGATMLEDIMEKAPRLKGLHVDIRLWINHYGGGSWHKNDLQRQEAWLKKNEALWKMEESKPTGKKQANNRNSAKI